MSTTTINNPKDGPDDQEVYNIIIPAGRTFHIYRHKQKNGNTLVVVVHYPEAAKMPRNRSRAAKKGVK